MEVLFNQGVINYTPDIKALASVANSASASSRRHEPAPGEPAEKVSISGLSATLAADKNSSEIEPGVALSSVSKELSADLQAIDAAAARRFEDLSLSLEEEPDTRKTFEQGMLELLKTVEGQKSPGEPVRIGAAVATELQGQIEATYSASKAGTYDGIGRSEINFNVLIQKVLNEQAENDDTDFRLEVGLSESPQGAQKSPVDQLSELIHKDHGYPDLALFDKNGDEKLDAADAILNHFLLGGSPESGGFQKLAASADSAKDGGSFRNSGLSLEAALGSYNLLA